MAGIYQGALLTLAATVSTGDKKGCFPTTGYPSQQPEILLLDNGLTGIAVRKRLRHWNKNTANDAAQFPLLSRGWVLQERLLSRRILHFCNSEMVWECREESTCECGGLNQKNSPGSLFHRLIQTYETEEMQDIIPSFGRFSQNFVNLVKRRCDKPMYVDQSLAGTIIPQLGVPNHASLVHRQIPWYKRARSSNTIRSADFPPLRPSTMRVDDVPEFVHHYHRLVEQYTNLKLTKALDRLPAFSGLCSRMQHFRGDYLAGLWSDSICFDLMWHIDKHTLWERTHNTRADRVGGPTWSWASAIGPVQYWSDVMSYKENVEQRLNACINNHSKPLIANRAMIRFKISRSEQNPFGSVNLGILSVEASWTRASLAYCEHRENNRVYSLIVSTEPDGEAEQSETDSEAEQTELAFFADYDYHSNELYETYAQATLAMLLVHPKVALVLKQSSHRLYSIHVDGEPAWERIGIAKLTEFAEEYIDWSRYAKLGTFNII